MVMENDTTEEKEVDKAKFRHRATLGSEVDRIKEIPVQKQKEKITIKNHPVGQIIKSGYLTKKVRF
jgi:hypothetical protein